MYKNRKQLFEEIMRDYLEFEKSALPASGCIATCKSSRSFLLSLKKMIDEKKKEAKSS